MVDPVAELHEAKTEVLEFETTSCADGDLSLCEKLIAEIKKYPALYDLECKEYHDPQVKGKLWFVLSAQLELDEDTCKKKWRNLRDQYIKKKKKLKTASRKASFRIKNWRYMEAMDFLAPHIYEREPKNKGNKTEPFSSPMEVISVNIDDVEEDGDSEIALENSHPQTDTSWEPTTMTTRRTFKRQRKSKNDIDDTMQDYYGHEHQMSLKAEPEPHSPPKSFIVRDEDEFFMLSCVPTLRKLSPYRKMELKCKIQQLLLEYTPKDECF